MNKFDSKFVELQFIDFVRTVFAIKHKDNSIELVFTDSGERYLGYARCHNHSYLQDSMMFIREFLYDNWSQLDTVIRIDANRRDGPKLL